MQTTSPVPGYRVSGTPAVVMTSSIPHSTDKWSLIVPCQTVGLLHTSRISQSYNRETWGQVNHVAKDLGIISSVSVAVVPLETYYMGTPESPSNMVAVYVASARLHVLEEEIGRDGWKAKTSTRIKHPGEVTGNPALIMYYSQHYGRKQLVFHFVRTSSMPDEWHMIARIAFPSTLPAISCIFFAGDQGAYGLRDFRAVVQCGGQLYQIATLESARPWSASQLRAIVGPGPSE